MRVGRLHEILTRLSLQVRYDSSRFFIDLPVRGPLGKRQTRTVVSTDPHPPCEGRGFHSFFSSRCYSCTDPRRTPSHGTFTNYLSLSSIVRPQHTLLGLRPHDDRGAAAKTKKQKREGPDPEISVGRSFVEPDFSRDGAVFEYAVFRGHRGPILGDEISETSLQTGKHGDGLIQVRGGMFLRRDRETGSLYVCGISW